MKFRDVFGKVFWGMFFILGGIFIVVSKLGFLAEMNIFTILLGVFLLAIFIKSTVHLSFFGMLFSAAFLLIMFDEYLNITAITPWPVLGAALLGAIGLECIFHGVKKKYNIGVFREHSWQGWRKDCPSCGGVNSDMECSDSENSVNTSFGAGVKYITSKDFKSACIKSSFAGTEVYFDGAEIPSGNAQVTVDVSFAGVELFVPKDWRVINNINSSMGGVSESGRCTSTGTPTLTLCGTVKFGGLDIYYV